MADPLTLKVMRVNRPSLAAAWSPFFSSSPALSAHATSTIMSLQSTEPLSGHPTTLRDLTAISDVLMLPPSFGAIQLGETFSSCLCINNDTNGALTAVSLRVEMQTASTKTVLASLGGPEMTLTPENSFIETVVSHEIKELGQHVLACTISYRRPGAPESEELIDIRKFYKFAVTNPLSVKTKVHTPRSPTALLTRAERDKVFLEVHVQNLTTDPLWFDQMRFECVEGWVVEDANVSVAKESIFSGSAALMQPQDQRQYVYILYPKPDSQPSFPVVHQPGANVPLGRLDISWRTSFGSPGRLLTSMLTRRIPIPAGPPPASALPAHLQRNHVASPRPGSISSSISSPPGSPFRPRAPPLRAPSRPQSPALGISAPVPAYPHAPLALPPAPPTPLDFDLALLDLPRDPVTRDTPFKLKFALTLASLPPTNAATAHRVVSLAVQHVQPARLVTTPNAVSAALASQLQFVQQAPSRASSPSPTPSVLGSRSSVVISRSASIVSTETLVESPTATHWAPSATSAAISAPPHTAGSTGPRLPPPFALDDGAGRGGPPNDGVLLVGNSALTLPPFVFSRPDGQPSDDSVVAASPLTDSVASIRAPAVRQELTHEFELTYLATRPGFVAIGGLRLLLLLDEERVDVVAGLPMGEPRILKEWDVVGEAYVN
ncbi:DUF974-domain-containing protein [Auriculariales sp. MPI-PUGE-AT-0066]|nr:DUF974-domain-containing protein [Auriculariales sp. MPI-PUGE-AT-0066]